MKAFIPLQIVIFATIIGCGRSETGALLRASAPVSLSPENATNAHTQWISSVHLKPGRSEVFVSTSWDKTACLWEKEAKEPVWRRTETSALFSSAWSQRGDMVAIGGDEYTTVVEALSGRVLTRIDRSKIKTRSFFGRAVDMQFVKRDRALLIAFENAIVLYDFESSQVAMAIDGFMQAFSSLRHIAMSDNQELIMATSLSEYMVFDARNGKTLERFSFFKLTHPGEPLPRDSQEREFRTSAMTKNGRFIAVGNRYFAYLIDHETKTFHKIYAAAADFEAMAFTQDERSLMIGARDGSSKIVSASRGEVTAALESSRPLDHPWFTAMTLALGDEPILVSGEASGHLYLWRASKIRRNR